MKDCDFKSGKPLLPSNKGGRKGIYDYELKEVGSLYFADLDTCHSPNPLKLIVHVIEGSK